MSGAEFSITIVAVEDAEFPHWSVTTTVTSYVPTDQGHPVLVVISLEETLNLSVCVAKVTDSVVRSPVLSSATETAMIVVLGVLSG